MGETRQLIGMAETFLSALFIIYATAKLIGKDNKEHWFKKVNRNKHILGRRGWLGETWRFGKPCTWQGLLTAACMYSLIAVIGYVLIFGR